jgi:hypothetical protein
MPILGIMASSISGSKAVTNSYESIATVTVGSGGSGTINFTSIPSTFKHLQIRYIARSNNAANVNSATGIQFNSDTGSNYSSHLVAGDGSSAGTDAFSSQTYMFGYLVAGGNANSGVFGTGIIDILDYTNVNKNKTVRALNGIDNNGSGISRFTSGLWINTSAITSILIDNRSGNVYSQYSQFALYGVKG